MAQKVTVSRILDAAEALFAERGFAETSLRTITSTAGVNLAAVNYHFGSKNALIQAVFVRFLDPFVETLNQHLESAENSQQEQLSYEELLNLILRSIILVHGSDSSRTVAFMRLLGMAYTQAQAHLRNYLADKYGKTYVRILAHLRNACPQLTDTDLFWYTHFSLGSSIFAMSNYEALVVMSEYGGGGKPSMKDVAQRLISFLAAGISGNLN